MTKTVRYRKLKEELEAIASEELADVLANWGNLSRSQTSQLRDYLLAELRPYGMLSVEKGHDAGQPMGRIRSEANRFLNATEWTTTYP